MAHPKGLKWQPSSWQVVVCKLKLHTLHYYFPIREFDPRPKSLIHYLLHLISICDDTARLPSNIGISSVKIIMKRNLFLHSMENIFGLEPSEISCSRQGVFSCRTFSQSQHLLPLTHSPAPFPQAAQHAGERLCLNAM